MAYVVTNRGPLNHDNKLYQEGETLSALAADVAATLLELGVIAEQPTVKGSQK